MSDQQTLITTPPVAFVGICERAKQIDRGHPIAAQHNLIGLGKAIIAHMFPLSLQHFYYVLAIFDLKKLIPLSVRLLSNKGEEVLKLNLARAPVDKPNNGATSSKPILLTLHNKPSWVTIVVDTLEGAPPVIKEPGVYSFVMTKDGVDTHLDDILIDYVPCPPLTNERIAAIRSNPNSSKKILFTIECNICNESLKTYAGLERDAKLESEGRIWYSELPDDFKCKCPRVYPLRYARENLGPLYRAHKL